MNAQDPAIDADTIETGAPEAPEAPAAGFAALGLDPRILSTLAALGYEEPTPVQLAAIGPLLRGRDLLAEAPTGTGKTAAFALPILTRFAARLDAAREAGKSVEGRGAPAEGRGSRPSSLILAPTRELAMQVAEAVHKYGRELGVRVVPVYGGQPITAQLHRLARGVDVVVATPGRAVDHIERGTLRFDEVETVVLDEADEMLDMGFAEDLERILQALPTQRQTALFSATIAGPIGRLAETHLRNPERVRVKKEKPAAGEAARVRQVAYVVRRPDKLAALGRILDLEDGAATLVFARTRGEVDDLAEALSGRGRDAAALHGGLSQEQRDRIMGRFRDGALDVLVATDVAARGLDIEHVTHVVNFDVPSSAETYVHRIGRTGRAGREGVAITLVEPREHRLLRDIEAVIGAPLAIEGLPTVADLREHRLDMLKGQLREALVAGGNDRYRGVVEALSGEFDLVDIALAALSQADAEARGAEDTTELAPAFLPTFERPMRGAGRRPHFAGGERATGFTPRPQGQGYGQRQFGGPNQGWQNQNQGWQNQGQVGGPNQGQYPNQGPRGGGSRQGFTVQPPQGGPQQGNQGWQANQGQQDGQQGFGPGPRPDQRPAPYNDQRPQDVRPHREWRRPDESDVPQGDGGFGGPGGPGGFEGGQAPFRPRHTGPGRPRPHPTTSAPRGFRPTGWRDPEGRPIYTQPSQGHPASGTTRLFVGAGRAAGMRPGDLVGAITNEAGLRGNDIGAIQIADGFSLVEVPEAAAEHVIQRLRGTVIRGQKVIVRRERY